MRGAIEGRIDAIYYSSELFGFLNTTNFPIQKIKNLVTSLKSGFGAGKQDQEQDETKEGIIQIRPTNIGNEGNLKFEKNVYLPIGLLQSEKDNFLQKGDVLFNNTNSQELVGKTAYFQEEGDFMFSNHITRIRVKQELILPMYLSLVLNILQRRKVFYSICTNWNNQSGVNADLLGSLKIPLPNLPTQAQIVAKFELAYKAKQTKEQKAKELLAGIDSYLLDKLGIKPATPEKDTKRSFFVRFSKVQGKRVDPFYHQIEFESLEERLKNGRYEAKKLHTVIENITKGETPAWKESKYQEMGIPFLRVQNIEIDGIKDDLILIPPKIHHDMKRSKLFGGEILYTMAGSIGIATIFPNDIGEANINQAIAKIVIKEDGQVSKKYIVELLNSTVCKQQSDRFLTVSAQPNINFEQIKSIKIPLPPLDIQNEIAQHIAEVRRQARELEAEAKAEVEKAKAEVEKMILGA